MNGPPASPPIASASCAKRNGQATERTEASVGLGGRASPRVAAVFATCDVAEAVVANVGAADGGEGGLFELLETLAHRDDLGGVLGADLGVLERVAAHLIQAVRTAGRCAVRRKTSGLRARGVAMRTSRRRSRLRRPAACRSTGRPRGRGCLRRRSSRCWWSSSDSAAPASLTAPACR